MEEMVASVDRMKVNRMTVAEAREKRVCRICEKPISLAGGPVDAPLEFGSQVFPQKLTFDFGAEFAHTDCLNKTISGDNKAC
jgi:hypothetical protein